jgi:hypothetical protein
VDEFGAKLNRQRVACHLLREDPAADAVTRLKHNHAQTHLTQLLGGGETGNARTQHQHICGLVLHVHLVSSS